MTLGAIPRPDPLAGAGVAIAEEKELERRHRRIIAAPRLRSELALGVPETRLDSPEAT